MYSRAARGLHPGLLFAGAERPAVAGQSGHAADPQALAALVAPDEDGSKDKGAAAKALALAPPRKRPTVVGDAPSRTQ